LAPKLLYRDTSGIPPVSKDKRQSIKVIQLMSSSSACVQQVLLKPLTADEFAPFGNVVQLGDGPRRQHVTGAVERTEHAIEPQLWIATVQQAVILPLTLKALERHPFSAQTFIPLNGCPYLVVVCLTDDSGMPDVQTLQAFRASGDQGVTYKRNVWHHGLSVLEARAQFVVSMAFTGEQNDDVFTPLETTIELLEA
jgi:ureidoglycolate lyase